MPTIWGRFKQQALNFVKEKVMTRVKGSKEQLLTSARKEILIKVVATAVPAYSMAVFKFPKKVCAEIDAILARFWWGQNGENEKLHWQSWGKLTRSRKDGGL